MDLGAFSISLAVKDLEASKSFYEKFGFRAFAGDMAQNWLIMKNGDHTIGLFQGGAFPICSKRRVLPGMRGHVVGKDLLECAVVQSATDAKHRVAVRFQPPCS
jgi:catechol 2,3-dioxygenase-like lactoylglutathione lyase family enzyme